MFPGRVEVLVAVGLALAGCGSSGKSPAHGRGSSDGSAGSSTTAPTDDACGAAALGLTGARAVDGWRLPAGCTFAPTHAGPGPTWITSEADLRAQVSCGDASPPLGVDFTREAIWLRHGSLSPAGAGTRAFDDGTSLTVVALMRSPCPDDPRPMPMPWTDALRVPLPATRALVEQSCTLRPSCS